MKLGNLVDSKPRALPTEDTHLARCYGVIDLGTQTWTFKNEESSGRKIIFLFELPYETHVFDDAKGAEPFSVNAEFIVSVGPNAKFRKFLESWRGRPYDKGEIDDIDPFNLVGQVAQLGVAHNDAKTWANIVSIMKAGKGQTCPDPVNRPLKVMLDKNEFLKKDFERTPQFLQKKIELSPEYKRLYDLGVIHGTYRPEDEDDIPGVAEHKANLKEREDFEVSEKKPSGPTILAPKDLDWDTEDGDRIPGLEVEDSAPPF